MEFACWMEKLILLLEMLLEMLLETVLKTVLNSEIVLEFRSTNLPNM